MIATSTAATSTARFTVHADELRAAVDFAVRTCSTRPSQPTLHGVLVEADEGLALSGFDGDLAGRVHISAEVLEPGRGIIPGRWLANVAKVARKGAVVEIACHEDMIAVSDGRDRWTLPALDLHSFPDLPTLGEPIGEVDAGELRRAILRALPAAERPGTEIQFHAACSVVGDGETLAVCGRDTWRLAVSYLPWKPAELDQPLDVLVPWEVFQTATGFLGPDGAVATLAVHRGLVTLASRSYSLTGRQVAAQWPTDWRAALASLPAPVAVATFAVDDLRAAVDRLLAVGDDRHSGAVMTISRDGFELRNWADERSGVAHAAAADYDAEPREIAFSLRYLKEALGALGSDLAAIRFGPRAGSPLDLVPLDEEGNPDESYRHLVSPMKLDVVKRNAR